MMHNKISRKILRRLVPVGGLLFFAGCAAESSMLPEPQTQTHEVPVVVVPYELIPVSYVVTGSVVSDARIQVSSRMMGFIRKIAVCEGEKISKGQLLATLDDADVEGNVRRVHAGLCKAKAALHDAETDVKRYEALFSRGSTSENALRKARLKRDVAANSCREVKAALQVAKAQRSYIRITSPVDGVVVARFKRKGDLATPGVPILTVESTHSLLFETHVAEARVSCIQVGNPVQVHIDAFEGIMRGTVIRVVPSGNPATRRYHVKIALPSKNHNLMPGMFGRCTFTTGSERSTVIPRSALTTRGGLEGVFRLDAGDRARFRWIRTGREWPDRVEVNAGLNSGEHIIAAIPPGLREGDTIREKRIGHEK